MASSKPPLNLSRRPPSHQHNNGNSSYHISRKTQQQQQQQTIYLPVNPVNPLNPAGHAVQVTPGGHVLPVHSSGPVVTIHSSPNFTSKPRLMAPPSIPQGQPIHIPIPPPPPPYTSVLMSVPPPPIRHIGIHPPPFSTRLPPPIPASTSMANGSVAVPPGVHIHHGQILPDPGLSVGVPTSNGLDRPPATYYAQSALAHHHHHHQHPNVNGNCQISELHSPTINITTIPVTHESSLVAITTTSNGFSTSTLDPHVQEFTLNDETNQVQENVKIKEKTPMCLINELARHNKTTHQYRLTDETGPSHKKNFTVCLKLGDTEEYLATGPSIKKAQHAAAAMALEKTKLKHPSPKPKQSSKIVPVTPTVELNTLAMKRCESATYTFITDQQMRTGSSSQQSAAAKFAHKRFQIGANGVQNFHVSLKVGNREFFGEACSAQAAKHDAAMNALKVLKDLPINSPNQTRPSGTVGISPGLNPKSVPFVPSSQKNNNHDSAPLENDEVADFEEEELSNDLVKSPISLVHESALKRNLVAHFEVTKETGPPHMRKFITRCRCGDFITDGEGNGKKTSKKRAAEMMLEQLRHLPPVISCQSPVMTGNGKSGKSARTGNVSKKAEMKKRKAKNLIKLEQKATPEYGQSINPISRLIQIQQAKKEKEPVYTLIAEKGMPRRREFVMQVTVGICTAKGSGPNKKLAKRAAAEALLQELGYSSKPPGTTVAQPVKPVLKSEKDRNGSNEAVATPIKKLTFSDETKVPIQNYNNTPGLIVIPKATSSDKEVTTSVKRVGEITTVSVNSSSSPVIEANQNFSSKTSMILSPKVQLQSLAEALGLKVSYRHINKKDKKDNFVSLVKLTTNPPKVFYGSGPSLDQSEVDAASKALLSIADSGIEEETIDEVFDAPK